jgi:ABC-type lipoprotein export system ATPase subunit
MFIEVDNLKKSYGQTEVLRGLNFGIEKSQEVAIVGQSGSGKSTLLYTIGALETIGSGSIKIDGQDITKLNDEELAIFRNNKVGFVFQFHFLLPSMTCIDNTLLPAKIGGHKTKLVKERVLKFAKILKVEHCLKKFPFELSGGEQQRINIIRAISLSPSLLLCDEPTGNLDSENSAIVIDLLRTVADEIDSTLVMVTHDNKISDSFQRKITIEDGQIIS